MGTPEGVGMARGRALRPGDTLRAEIEGLGVLNTYII
jgi:2-keto-4-pentenoate hydratase/2-oxohepta-3-ene-1,7-dioic acid hydratase in catechol pathway